MRWWHVLYKHFINMLVLGARQHQWQSVVWVIEAYQTIHRTFFAHIPVQPHFLDEALLELTVSNSVIGYPILWVKFSQRCANLISLVTARWSVRACSIMWPTVVLEFTQLTVSGDIYCELNDASKSFVFICLHPIAWVALHSCAHCMSSLTLSPL